jgi:hypothetical protein
VPPERRSLQLSCCEPGASYYAEGFSPLPGRCFRLVTGTARTADTLPEPATWRGTFRARDGRRTGSRRARVTGGSTSSRGLPYAKGRAVLVPVQFAGGLTSNASSSTNETKHPAEGSQVWTRVRDSWWLVGCLRISSCSRSPVVIRLGGKSVEEDVHPLRTWGVTLGVQGVVACGWMWWMPGGGSVRS